MPPRRRRLKRFAVYLGLGAAVTVIVCIALALTDDLTAATTVQTAEGWAGDERWTVTRHDRPGGTRVVSTRSPGHNWSPGQALGPPDTPTGGDQVTAWASSSADGSREWLLLEFPRAVVPKAVRVYEMCSTGALDKVSVVRADGTEVTAWAGVDPTPRGQSMGTSEIPLASVTEPIDRVRLHLDSPNVPGWNEIDAVGLVGQDDSVQWAAGVESSSIYGGSVPSGAGSFDGPQRLLPAWARVAPPESRGMPEPSTRPTNARLRSFVHTPDVIAEARGWPMLALAARRERPPRTGSASGSVRNGTAYSLGPLTSSFAAPAADPATGPLLPSRPIPLGFAVNTLLAAAVFWLLHLALTVPIRFVREASRVRYGRCVACGYDLGYDFVAGCPECGWRREGRVAGDGSDAVGDKHEIRSSQPPRSGKSEKSSKSETGKLQTADAAQ